MKPDCPDANTPVTADSRTVEELRYEKLMPFVRCAEWETGAAVEDDEDERASETLDDAMPELVAALKLSEAWIRQRIAEVAAIGWEHATPAHFALGKSNGGKGKSRLEPELLSKLIESIETVCRECQLRPGKPEAVEAVVLRLISEHGVDKGKIPSRPTILRIMRSAIGWHAYAGPYKNDHINRPGLERRKADALLACVVMDWTGFSQDHRELIVLTDNFEVTGRANLISAIDEASRIPWTWLWCVGAPNSELIGECVCRGLVDKTRILRNAGFSGDYPVSGRPFILRHDNGKDMTAGHMKKAIEEIGIRFDECSPPHTPHYNGIQERFQGVAKRMFLDYLTKLKLDNTLGLEESYPERLRTRIESKKIYICWSELETLWVKWLCELYIKRPHKGLQLRTPLQRYRELVAGEGVHFVGIPKCSVDSVEVRWPFLLRQPVNNFNGVVDVKGRKYSSVSLDEALGFHTASLRFSFEVRWSQYDLTRMYYRHRTGEIIEIPLVSPILLPSCSQAEWVEAKGNLQRAGVLRPSCDQIAELIRARKERLYGRIGGDQMKINNADRMRHLMQCVMGKRFQDAVKQEVAATAARRITTLAATAIPELAALPVCEPRPNFDRCGPLPVLPVRSRSLLRSPPLSGRGDDRRECA